MRQHKGQGSDRQPETSVQRKAAGTPGKATLIPHGDAVQLHGAGGGGAADSADVHAHAERGVAGAGAALPHGDRIQQLFGSRHDVSTVQAHTGGEAAGACEAIGASAYATGNHVAFAGQPSLHTAAHEAAHVVQQRGGVQLKGGVGQAGDAYEQHADAVADKVVAGESAASLLDTMAGGGAQMAVQRATPISETTDTGNKYTQQLDVLPTKIQIQLAVEWVKQGTWADDAAFHTFTGQCKTTVYGYLDNKFKIVATPKPSSGAKAWERPIDFLLQDSAGYKINVYGGSKGGCSMAQAGGTIYEQTVAGAPQDPVTIAHEFGHALLGQSDEYANPAVPGRVISNDHSIMGNYKTQGRAQAEFKVRHFQHILAAVSPQFPDHTCTLAKV